jgi:hypothetical protein
VPAADGPAELGELHGDLAVPVGDRGDALPGAAQPLGPVRQHRIAHRRPGVVGRQRHDVVEQAEQEAAERLEALHVGVERDRRRQEAGVGDFGQR